MAFVVTGNCQKCKFTDCVEVCPVDCFYELDDMLVIHPDECIDCGACVPECPVEAIYEEDEVSDADQHWIAFNAQHAQSPNPVITEMKNALPGAEARRAELGF